MKRRKVTGGGIINVSYPVLDEHGYAVAALTVPYIRRIGDNTTTAIVRQSLKRASSQLSQEIGESRQRARNWKSVEVAALSNPQMYLSSTQRPLVIFIDKFNVSGIEMMVSD